ncbi:HAD-like domain-containing protein [Melampsora americana]|nr:HAD-like domain-containing protein [Melampsora americana]
MLFFKQTIYTTITNEILEPFNKQLTWEIKASLMGRPAIESAALLVKKTEIPISGEEFTAKMKARQLEMFPHVKPMPGAERLVEHLYKNKIPMAIATGSIRQNFNLKTSNLKHFFSKFGQNVICGDSIEMKRGKPNPDPFLLAAKKFLGLQISSDEKGNLNPLNEHQLDQLDGLRPDEILVFEDGIPGVRAAKAAGMRVIWVPDPELKKLQLSQGTEAVDADEVLDSLEEWNGLKWGLPPLP